MSTAHIFSGLLIATFFWMTAVIMSLPYKTEAERGGPRTAAWAGGRRGKTATGDHGGHRPRLQVPAEHLVVFKFEYDPAEGELKNLVVGEAVKPTVGKAEAISEIRGPYFPCKKRPRRGGYVDVSCG